MQRSKTSVHDLRKIRLIADYQFGRNGGVALFPSKGLEITRSRNTGRIRRIYLNGRLVATLRPKDGMLALTSYGGRLLLKGVSFNKLPITIVRNDVARFIREGKNLFCKHVIYVSTEIRAGDEVIIVDEDHRLAAVGRAALSADEIKDFKIGIAVKVRWGKLEGETE
ncbi:MAG: pseudouridine synthase [Nitrososphaeria archaeon]|nr:pseudouridine synthase [Nitrososphaeria archaeon]